MHFSIITLQKNKLEFRIDYSFHLAHVVVKTVLGTYFVVLKRIWKINVILIIKYVPLNHPNVQHRIFRLKKNKQTHAIGVLHKLTYMWFTYFSRLKY